MSGVSGTTFPKSAHLLKHADFQHVYQNGKRHFSGNLTAFYLRRDSGDGVSPVRVGFTVGKVLGGAVERNRIRRRTREAVRFHLDDLRGISDSVDIIIHPKKSVLNIDFCVLSEEVGRAFQVVRRSVERRGKASAE
ncbi:MAG TPA: ribonuclease P protein component [Terriglobales bacterium]|nr:ribonuclease P protein component [Terriglobales bacterium]